LQTDYADAQRPEKDSCVSNIGFALSASEDASALDRVSDGSSDWSKLTIFVEQHFDQAETAGLAQVINEYRAQIPPAEQRRKVRMSLLTLRRAQLDSRRELFFFEASREYPKPANAFDAGCPNIFLLLGWIVRERGQLSLINTDFSATDCDEKEGGRTQAYAILRLDGKAFAIVVEYSYEGESYVIFEIRRSSLVRVLETYAGSC
jgi:hypothetical protein